MSQHTPKTTDRITRQEFLRDRKAAGRWGNTWTTNNEDNTLDVYTSLEGYGRRILASYKCVFTGVTESMFFKDYVDAARAEAYKTYYNK